MKTLNLIFRKLWLAIVAVALISFTACTDDSYTENYTQLDSSNLWLHYPDTTTVVKWMVGSSIPVVKPDSFRIKTNFPFRLVLDTIIGEDSLSYKTLNTSVIVDSKTGQIKLNNSKKLFKTGNYNFFVGVMTENGITKFRDKPVKLYLKP